MKGILQCVKNYASTVTRESGETRILSSPPHYAVLHSSLNKASVPEKSVIFQAAELPFDFERSRWKTTALARNVVLSTRGRTKTSTEKFEAQLLLIEEQSRLRRDRWKPVVLKLTWALQSPRGLNKPDCYARSPEFLSPQSRLGAQEFTFLRSFWMVLMGLVGKPH